MGWQVVIAVDPSLGEPGGPEPPQIAPSTITLHEPVSLIGRKSEARAIFPEIPLQHDDAVSHRHAVVQLAQDGTLSLRDVGASNGTKLNGQQIKQMVDYPLKDGDQVTLGRWSRLTIQALP